MSDIETAGVIVLGYFYAFARLLQSDCFWQFVL